ncbi:MAG: hypothetical protein P8H31_04035 [Porticoccaceae bacterium]|nr:hypothetical protein [Porticoccaceae bacterium]
MAVDGVAYLISKAIKHAKISPFSGLGIDAIHDL